MKPLHLIVFIAFVSCGGQNTKNETEKPSNYDVGSTVYESNLKEETPTETDKTIAETINTVNDLPDVANPKLIRNADLRFQVKDLNEATSTIESIVKNYDSYISTANMRSTNSESNNFMSIRVPNVKFDALLNELCKSSIHIDRKNVTTQDVTEEWVDIEARLKTKKEVEQRYIEILKSKAKTVKEVLDAEAQLLQIREEIEAREGRLKYLQNQVAYSTVSVEIYQQIQLSDNPQEVTESFGQKAGNGFGKGWTIIQEIVIAIITLWPLWLFGIGLYYGIRKLLKYATAKK